MDQEAPRAITLQEPCQNRGPSHKLVRRYQCDRRGGARQPSPRISGSPTHGWLCGRTALSRSAEIEAALRIKQLRSRIHRKGRRNKPLSERRSKATRPVRRFGSFEHVFGAQSRMGGTLVRSVGLVRAKARIGLKIAYNMRRRSNWSVSGGRIPEKETAWGRSCGGNNSTLEDPENLGSGMDFHNLVKQCPRKSNS